MNCSLSLWFHRKKPEVVIVKSYIKVDYNCVIDDILKSTQLIDLKINSVCPFMMLNKCTKFDESPCKGFVLNFLLNRTHTHTHSSGAISPSQVVRGDNKRKK